MGLSPSVPLADIPKTVLDRLMNYAGFLRLVPVVARQCQTLPASASHSHSIINKPTPNLSY